MMFNYISLFFFIICSLNAFAKTDNDKYVEILKQIPKTDLHAHFTATVPEKMLPAKPQRNEFKNNRALFEEKAKYRSGKSVH